MFKTLADERITAQAPAVSSDRRTPSQTINDSVEVKRKQNGTLHVVALCVGLVAAAIVAAWSGSLARSADAKGHPKQTAKYSRSVPAIPSRGADAKLTPTYFRPAPATSTGTASVTVAQERPQVGDGLDYTPYIPRPTRKGYYEPKVIPHPVGKPVFVQGYYRKDGTYVRPHFRSLPRR